MVTHSGSVVIYINKTILKSQCKFPPLSKPLLKRSNFGKVSTDACLTADQGVQSSILAWSHTFMEIDREIISTVILLPSAE